MHLQGMPKPQERQLEREIEMHRDQVCLTISMALTGQLEIKKTKIYVKIVFHNNCDMVGS
jgi:hypothetical protein